MTARVLASGYGSGEDCVVQGVLHVVGAWGFVSVVGACVPAAVDHVPAVLVPYCQVQDSSCTWARPTCLGHTVAWRH